MCSLNIFTLLFPLRLFVFHSALGICFDLCSDLSTLEQKDHQDHPIDQPPAPPQTSSIEAGSSSNVSGSSSNVPASSSIVPGSSSIATDSSSIVTDSSSIVPPSDDQSVNNQSKQKPMDTNNKASASTDSKWYLIHVGLVFLMLRISISCICINNK